MSRRRPAASASLREMRVVRGQRRVARRVVVDEDHARGVESDGVAEEFADSDERRRHVALVDGRNAGTTFSCSIARPTAPRARAGPSEGRAGRPRRAASERSSARPASRRAVAGPARTPPSAARPWPRRCPARPPARRPSPGRDRSGRRGGRGRRRPGRPPTGPPADPQTRAISSAALSPAAPLAARRSRGRSAGGIADRRPAGARVTWGSTMACSWAAEPGPPGPNDGSPPIPPAIRTRRRHGGYRLALPAINGALPPGCPLRPRLRRPGRDHAGGAGSAGWR